MKNLPTAFLFFCAMFCIKAFSQNSSKPFKIVGKIAGRDTGILVLRYVNESEKLIRDTVHLSSSGSFSFKGSINQPTYATIKGHSNYINFYDANDVGFFLDEGIEYISLVEDEYENAKIEGAKPQREFDSLQLQINFVLKVRYKTLNEEYLKTKKEYLKTKDPLLGNRADSLYNELKPSSKEVDKIVVLFIAQHPDSYVSAYMLYHLIRPLPLDSAELLYTNLSTKIQKSRDGKWDSTELFQKQKSMNGQIAPDFVREEIGGNKLALSSFKGKSYILLDFWASWCAPCRDFNPHLKELYSKYHSKGLEIIGISCEAEKTAWKNAIKKDKTQEWYHVLENKSSSSGQHKFLESDNSLRQLYNIMPIPAQILIDKNGIVVGRFLADASGLDKKLVEMFK